MQVTGSADDPSSVWLTFSGGPNGVSFGGPLAAPPGRPLTAGVYTGAQRSPFRESGRPGIDISGEGRGCNQQAGQFEIRDIARAPDGTIKRFWALFEQHCEGGPSTLFGEVRLGEPDVTVLPTVLRWPSVEPGGQGATTPVTLTPAHATTVTRVGLVGADAASFLVRDDDCTGRALRAGEGCQVWVRFTPAGPGTREAGLRIATDDGDTTATVLQGFAHGGTTAVRFDGDPGDWVAGGMHRTFSNADGLVTFAGRPQIMSFGINAGSDWFSGTLSAPDGDILAPGSVFTTSRYPFNGPGAGLDITGDGHGCNQSSGTIWVDRARWALDGTPITFAARAEQHCDGGPALHADIKYRDGDTTTPPRWETAGDGATPLPALPALAAAPAAAAAPAPAATPAPSSAAAPAPAAVTETPARRAPADDTRAPLSADPPGATTLTLTPVAATGAPLVALLDPRHLAVRGTPACRAGSAVVLRLSAPRGVTLRSAQVLLGDRRVRSLSGRALLRPLTIARPRGRFTLSVRAQGSRAGRPVSLTARRTFAACA